MFEAYQFTIPAHNFKNPVDLGSKHLTKISDIAVDIQPLTEFQMDAARNVTVYTGAVHRDGGLLYEPAPTTVIGIGTRVFNSEERILLFHNLHPHNPGAELHGYATIFEFSNPPKLPAGREHAQNWQVTVLNSYAKKAELIEHLRQQGQDALYRGNRLDFLTLVDAVAVRDVPVKCIDTLL